MATVPITRALRADTFYVTKDQIDARILELNRLVAKQAKHFDDPTFSKSEKKSLLKHVKERANLICKLNLESAR
jgi:hypothetical protein